MIKYLKLAMTMMLMTLALNAAAVCIMSDYKGTSAFELFYREGSSLLEVPEDYGSPYTDLGVYYYSLNGFWSGYDFAVLADSNYRFGWYTLPENVSELDDSKPSCCTVLLSDGNEISSEAAKKAKESSAQYLNDKLICLKATRVYEITVATSSAAGGTCSFSTKDPKYDTDGKVAEGAGCTLTATADTGYSFSHWARNGANVSEKASYTFTAASSTAGEYQAVFSAKTYTITFDADGGTGAGAKQDVVYDQSLATLSTPKPGKRGYVFKGYFTQRSGGGTQWFDSDGQGLEKPWNLTANTTLYACWEPGVWPFNVILGVGVAKVCYRIEDEVDFHEVTATAEPAANVPVGKMVYAYAVPEADFQVDYTIEDQWRNIMTTEALTLTYEPKATRVGFWLTVDPNGGVYRGSSETRTLQPDRLAYGATNLNSIGVATRAEKVFQGFYADNVQVYDQSGKWVEGTYWHDGKYLLEKDLSVTARWTDVVYYQTVTFHDPTGVFTDESCVVIRGTAATAPEWARVGYERSWNRDFSAVTADITVDAVWTPIEYVIGFDAGGGTGVMTNLTVKYDQEVELPANAFVNGILTFRKWTNDVAGVTREFADRAVVSNLTSVANETNVLVAVWGKDYLVAFDGNGATKGTMAQQRFERDVPAMLATNEYARTGYTFVGWAANQADAAARKIAYTNNAEVVNLAPLGCTNTLVAAWSNNPYRVRFEVGEGGQPGTEPSEKACSYDVAWQLPAAPTPTSVEYTFDGWYLGDTNVGGSGDSVSNLTAEADVAVTLRGRWSFDVGDLSRALGCTNLTFVAEVGSRWDTGIKEPSETSASTTCVQKVEQNGGALSVIVRESGTLAFKLFLDDWVHLRVSTNGVQYSEYEGKVDWQEISVKITTAQTKVTFTSEDASSAYPAKLADVTWTPDGGEEDPPVPKPTDAPTVTGATMKDGKLEISATGDPRFDYRVLTSTSLTPPVEWTPLEGRKPGEKDQELQFEILVDPAEPSRFYKLEVLQKQK